MKKILFAIAFTVIMVFSANAQTDGFFKWNDRIDNNERETNGVGFSLPPEHGYNTDQTTPLGSGLIILGALGAGYAVVRKKRS